MKCSIRILRKMRGWLLSSQKAVWLLTTHYFGGCPLTFMLTKDEDQSTEYTAVPPPCIIDTISLMTQALFLGMALIDWVESRR